MKSKLICFPFPLLRKDPDQGINFKSKLNCFPFPILRKDPDQGINKLNYKDKDDYKT